MPKLAALNTYSDLELSLMVLLNYFGTGSTRKKNLGNRYAAVQKIVDQICHGTVPPGKGNKSPLDPTKLENAIAKVFSSDMDEIKKEIMKNYEQN